MTKITYAKENDIPVLKFDGSNYGDWKASFLGFYCGQLDVVMEIATDEIPKDDDHVDERKALVTAIFKSIDSNLRKTLVTMKQVLRDGYKMWCMLEDRFDRHCFQLDVEEFMGLKQGSKRLSKFIATYEGLRMRIGEKRIKELFPNDKDQINHLRRSLNITSINRFPHGEQNYAEVIKILLDYTDIEQDYENGSNALAARKVMRCYRCGEEGHHIRNCKNKLKCFRCNGTGHISKDCPKEKDLGRH